MTFQPKLPLSGMPAHHNSRRRAWENPPPTAAAAAKRRGRIEAGRRQKREETAAWPGLQPARSELMIPLLKTIADAGIGKPADVAEAVADALGIPAEVRSATAEFKGRASNLWHRTVRWTMQDARRQGYIFAEERGRWRMTDVGNDALGRVRTGMRLVVFRTALGEAYAAVAQEAAAIVEPGSVQTLFTSPLFPLCSDMKRYGTMEPSQWLPWMMDLIESWIPMMRDDGIMAIHLGATHYRGLPEISGYRERFVLACTDDLGLHRMPDLFWENPSRLTNIVWGRDRGMMPRPVVDPVYLLSKSEMPFMDADSMRGERTRPVKADKRQGKQTRPSGLSFGETSFASNKDRFPSALISAGNPPGSETWRKTLREQGREAHPCPMPMKLPSFVIQLTSRPDDLVCDPFLGSGTTAAAAQALGRRWIGIDHHAEFLKDAALRPQFTRADGYELIAA